MAAQTMKPPTPAGHGGAARKGIATAADLSDTHGCPHASVPLSWPVTVSRHPLGQTVDRLKHALQAHDLWLIHDIDTQMLLKRGGHDIPGLRQLLFFHPRYMARLLSTDPNALNHVPLKFIVMERPGGEVTFYCADPLATFAPYPALADLARDLAEVCHQIALAAT